MKKISLLVSLLISTNCFANELNHFNEVQTAATAGKTIHIAVDFSKCTFPMNALNVPSSIGIFTPNTVQVTNDHIATSLTHFTINNPAFPEKAIYEFATYTITTKDQLNITMQFLDAANYTPLGNKITFNCKLGVSAKIYS